MKARIKHIGEYILFKIFIILFTILPYKLSVCLGGWIAKKISRFFIANNIARKNLKMVFPNLNDQEIKQIILGMWESLGFNIAEFIHFTRMSKEQILAKVEIIGRKHIDPFIKLQNKQPILFYTAHYSNWELCNLVVASLGFDFNAIYRPANNKLIDKKIALMRKGKRSITMHEKGSMGAKSFVKSLKNNQAGGLLIDQKLNEGIKVPFFAKEAFTSKFIIAIAKKYQIPIIPFHVIRDKKGAFKVIIEKAFNYADIKDLSDREALILLNKNIENWIKNDPKQWFWVHNRWDN